MSELVCHDSIRFKQLTIYICLHGMKIVRLSIVVAYFN